jgi:D-hexose-6-phosphate mutarotase
MEKIQLVKHIRECESKLAELNKEEKNMETFFDLINNYFEIVDLNRNDVTRLIDKVVIHERKNKFNKRMFEIYFVYVGVL